MPTPTIAELREFIELHRAAFIAATDAAIRDITFQRDGFAKALGEASNPELMAALAKYAHQRINEASQ